ncbi:expressed unknown protein [Seminavis robusta]|uniref:Uncharacterized protein n=1 Tax=Seminavis robusta TaxID=568900 RepID=A0A9N8EBF6_9STRA|nr:expressed unknown protein [Seminavis robusta]|eukprot:Sro762_g198780.1 n/a (906) ;mRNA; f:41791-44508
MSASQSNDNNNSTGTTNDTSATGSRMNGSTGPSSSFSRLLDTNTSTNRGLRRRGSLFDDLSLRQNNGNDEASSFSLSSMPQNSSSAGPWQKRRRKSLESKKRRRESAYMDDEEESTTLSSSRSLFTASAMNAAANTQDEIMTNHSAATIPAEDICNTTCTTVNQSSTPKASGRTSLFGSVMQQVGGHMNSSTPVKSTTTNNAMATTTPLARKGSLFSPSNRSKESFGTPGGFQLLDFVNNFGSPFSNNNNPSPEKSKSPSSHSSNHIDWHNASLDHGVMDWSLPDSIRFDFHPGYIVNPILQTNVGSGPGLLKFLQPLTSVTNDGLAQWEAGLLYWQHPAIYPSPFASDESALKSKMMSDANKKKEGATTAEGDKILRQKQLSKHGKKKRRATLDLADTKPIAETSNFAVPVQTKSSLSTLQRQKALFTRQRRLDWQQSFVSLYWKWISQLRKVEEDRVDYSYFYSRGTDHSVLFRGVYKSGQVLPEIVFTSSSRMFRRWLHQSGVEAIRLAEEWRGHCRGTVFTEAIIRQQKPPLKEKAHAGTSKTKSHDSQGILPDKILKENNPQSTDTPSNSNCGNGSKSNLPAPTPSKTTSPSDSSTSPCVKAELAALRRAQVFGETVGADVSVSIKPKAIAGPKVSLGSLPPLVVTGWDDCAAFFEVYLNLGTTCCISSLRDAGGGKADGAVDDAKGSSSSTTAKADNEPSQNMESIQRLDWQGQHDVPVLICRGLGPFANATMKSLTASGAPHFGQNQEGEGDQNTHEYASLEIQGGPILPCAIMELLQGLAQIMLTDHKRNPPKDAEMSHDGDALVSSHSLILRAVPGAAKKQAEEFAQKHGIVGGAGSQKLNNGHPKGNLEGDGDKRPSQIPSGLILGTSVWDILHPGAIAYKLEPVDTSASQLLLN